MQKLEEYMDKFGFLQYSELPLLKKISKKTKIPSPVIVLIILAIFIGLAMTPFFAEVLTTFVVFFVPAFRTFQALQTETQEDDAKMLTYWIVFGTVFTFDKIFRKLLGFFGFYTYLRAIILFLLFSFDARGSQFLYARIIRPFFNKFGGSFDEAMEPLEEQGRRISRYINNQKDEYHRVKKMQKEMDLVQSGDNDDKMKQD